MKVEIAPGIVTVKPGFIRGPSSRPVSGVKSFAPHYPDFNVAFILPDKWFVTFSATLSDGIVHNYWYDVGGEFTITSDISARCQTGYFPGESQPFGGILYNLGVRPFLSSKDVPPV